MVTGVNFRETYSPAKRSSRTEEVTNCDVGTNCGISIDIDLVTSNSNAPASATSPPGFWASQAPWTKGSSPRRHANDPSWDLMFSEALHRAAAGGTDSNSDRSQIAQYSNSRKLYAENEATFFAEFDQLVDIEIEKRLVRSR